MNYINAFIQNTAMYRLMLYYLLAIVVAAILASSFGLLPYNPLHIFQTAVFLGAACELLNRLFARIRGIRPNTESAAITALILSLIIGPFAVLPNLNFLLLAAAAAMASKYIIVVGRRHIFNPAAFSVLITALILSSGASWWAGNPALLPIVTIGGLLFTHKMRWFHLISSFLVTYLALHAALIIVRGNGSDIIAQIYSVLRYSPLLFFSFVMLTEPLTMPTGRRPRIVYGITIGALAVILPAAFDIFYSLELSLLIGNIVGLLAFYQPRLLLRLKNKYNFAARSTAFLFDADKKLPFLPGQFLLWSLPHEQPDTRGLRRYFTVASSPTEDHFMFITKFSDKSSSFKQALQNLKPGDALTAMGVDGSFTLPKNPNAHCVFLAGGVGIAPFRSMVKFLLDTKHSRPITLLYSNNTPEEIGFRELFNEAHKIFGMKTVYTITAPPPLNWQGRTGFISEEMVKQEVSDHQNALYYISGPEPMVKAMRKTLRGMDIPSSQIKTDYFPGYA